MSLLLAPFRLVLFAVLLPVRLSRASARVFGLRGTLAFLLGVGVGVLVAPRPGEETRRVLRERLEEWRRGAPGPGWDGPEPGG